MHVVCVTPLFYVNLPKVCVCFIGSKSFNVIVCFLKLILSARRYASIGNSYGPVSVCVCLSACLSQVGILSNEMN